MFFLPSTTPSTARKYSDGRTGKRPDPHLRLWQRGQAGLVGGALLQVWHAGIRGARDHKPDSCLHCDRHMVRRLLCSETPAIWPALTLFFFFLVYVFIVLLRPVGVITYLWYVSISTLLFSFTLSIINIEMYGY